MVFPFLIILALIPITLLALFATWVLLCELFAPLIGSDIAGVVSAIFISAILFIKFKYFDD